MRIRDVDMNVRAAGNGRPFIWGHGLMFSMAMEDALGIFGFTRPADKTNARIIRYDARGHGLSGGSRNAADYAWPALARDMLAVADAVGTERFIAGGQSMGAATALWAAMAAPDRIDALVLATPPTAWEMRAAQAALYAQMAAVVEGKGIAALRAIFEAQPSKPGWLWEWSSQSGGPAHIARALDYLDPGPLPYVLRGAGQTDMPAQAALRGLAVPTLILAWSDDPVHPLAAAETLAGLLPDARLEIARDATAVLAWPDRVRAFLARLPGRL
jgi:pimeloyl-ACP methyl ester carboxylesterase